MRLPVRSADEEHVIEDVDVSECSLELLRLQIYSVTEIEPEEQDVMLLTAEGEMLSDLSEFESSLPLLESIDGVTALVKRRAVAPPPSPPPAPSPAPPPPPQPPAPPVCDTRAMEGRLRSGFETALLHDDPEELRFARSVVPWKELRAKAAVAQAEASPSGAPPLLRLRAAPEMARLVAAAREAPQTVAPLLGELAESSPALLQLIRENQEDFRALLNGTDEAASQPEAAPDEWELRELLCWFKHGFFAWTNEPRCEATGEPTTLVGMARPTAEEQAGLASRVEVFKGPTGHLTRFPRYKRPSTLLAPGNRRGRCGEFANAFTMCCRAVGFEARWVLDVTDHVWSEVWLPSRQMWVHADPCECALDAPLMYEKGWGKKLSYVLAFTRHEAADVSARYSRDWAETLARRTEVREGWLELTVASLNQTRQAALPAAARAAIEARAQQEREQLAELSRPAPPEPPPEQSPEQGPSEQGPSEQLQGPSGGSRCCSDVAAQPEASRSTGVTTGADSTADEVANPESAERRGRQTGTVEWRRARGELGDRGVQDKGP